MNEADKVKLKTEIERDLHKLICIHVKDQVRDFVMLTSRRNKIPVENNTLEYLVKTMETAVDEAFHRNADKFVEKFCADAEKYSELLDKAALMQKVSVPKE